MKFSRILISTAVLVTVAALTSCRKDLCYNHFREVAIELDWEHEWERDYGCSHSSTWDAQLHGFSYDELKPEKPSWINMIAYEPGGNASESFLSIDGGTVKVEEGDNRSFLLYNGDTEHILITNASSLTEAYASTTSRTRSSLEAFASNYSPTIRSTNPPDILYAAMISQMPEVGLHKTKTLKVTMQTLVYTYLIRYEFEAGLEHVAMARGAIGGMAESVYLHSGITSEKSSIILFDCDLTDYGCVANVRSFGVPGFPDEYYGKLKSSKGEEDPFTLNLEVRLTNGSFVEFNFDISDQIANQPRGGVIRVSGIRIEDDQNQNDAGFEVDVTDWGEHEDFTLPVTPK